MSENGWTETDEVLDRALSESDKELIERSLVTQGGHLHISRNGFSLHYGPGCTLSAVAFTREAALVSFDPETNRALFADAPAPAEMLSGSLRWLDGPQAGIAMEVIDADRRAVYVSEGLGHAFMALTDDAVVTYLCSTGYAPEREHGVNPLDSRLAIPWPSDVEPILSDKDRAAPTLRQAAADGILPTYAECLAYRASLRSRG